jgi:hypothetical protein
LLSQPDATKADEIAGFWHGRRMVQTNWLTTCHACVCHGLNASKHVAKCATNLLLAMNAHSLSVPPICLQVHLHLRQNANGLRHLWIVDGQVLGRLAEKLAEQTGKIHWMSSQPSILPGQRMKFYLREA